MLLTAVVVESGGRFDPDHGLLLYLEGLVVHFSHLDLDPLLIADRRQEVLRNVVLPVLKHAIALNLLIPKINVLDVHPGVVCVVSEGHF